MNRKKMLERVNARNEPWDFIIIGGGATGVGTAIEAASRGAKPIVLVEKDPIKFSTIKRNISFVEGKIEVYIKAAERFLKLNTNSFDYIFIDPPFNYKTKADIICLIADNKTLGWDASFRVPARPGMPWQP